MIAIIRHRRWWFWFSGTLIAASIISVVLWQFKFGIDFTGGSLLEVRFEKERPVAAAVQKSLAAFGEAGVQPAGDQNMLIRLSPLDQITHQKLLDTLNQQFEKVTELRFDSIGPTIGIELRNKAITALLIVFAAIIVYIAYAFRRVSRPISSWVYGAITVATAFHDVSIPLGLFSILGRWRGIEIGSGFVAAVLTIMGYSIMDTIVVLDRVRENLARGSGAFEEVVEKSVHQSFARSINTSMTTLLALVAIFFFGGETVKYFALALIAGIITGSYSSIFIAAPLLVVWQRYRLTRR